MAAICRGRPTGRIGGARRLLVAKRRAARKRRCTSRTSTVIAISSTPSTPAEAGLGAVSPMNSLKASTAKIGMSSASTKGTPKFSSVSMKTSRAPASTAGITIGRVTVQTVRRGEEPSPWAASSIETSTALKAAMVGSRT